MQEFIELDCSEGTGGGQIIRTALALSVLLEKPVHLSNIRAGRESPGLKPQHLTAVKALATISNAETKGDFLQSTEIFFSPKKTSPQNLNINIGTAGAISLLLQQLLPVSLKEHIELHIAGGTSVAFAPSIFFLQKDLFPKLRLMNAKFSAEILAHGFFPKGNGRVFFKAEPSKLPLKPIVFLETGNLNHFECFSVSSSLPSEVSTAQAKTAKRILLEKFEADWIEKIESKQERKDTIGSSIDLFACFEKTVLGTNALGEKGKPALEVGKEAAEKPIEELSANSPIDSHCADQLLVFMALAKGKSEIAVSKFTEHCRTNISIIEKFLECKFAVEGELNMPAKISVEGIGFK